MIADTERGLDFSAELITLVSRCDVARGIPRYGITPRASGNNNRLSALWLATISLAGVARSLFKVSSYRNFRRAIVSRGGNCRDRLLDDFVLRAGCLTRISRASSIPWPTH